MRGCESTWIVTGKELEPNSIKVKGDNREQKGEIVGHGINRMLGGKGSQRLENAIFKSTIIGVMYTHPHTHKQYYSRDIL